MICARALPESHKLLVCGQCQQKPPHYQTSIIPHIYSSPIKQFIAAMKFQQDLSASHLLASLLAKRISNRTQHLPDCIIPVPLHFSRLRQRGYNQALEMAKIICQSTQIPIDYACVKRVKPTLFQSGLTVKQRRQNLRQAFEVTRPLSYQHVAILDDVVTTGATVNELARCLKDQGIKIIEVWAIARTTERIK